MRIGRIPQASLLLLAALLLLSGCDGSGKLEKVRVANPLDGTEIALPVEDGYGQLAGNNASFQTKQTPQELCQAYQALEAEQNLQVTPYPGGLLIARQGGSGARYCWLCEEGPAAKQGRSYLLTNMEADLVSRLPEESAWVSTQESESSQTPVTGAPVLLPYHLIAPEELSSGSSGGCKNVFCTGVLYRLAGTQEEFYQFYASMNAYRMQQKENGFAILAYAEGFDEAKALRSCTPVAFTFYTINGNLYFSAALQ